MREKEYEILSELILAECDIPDDLFPVEDGSEKNCYFLFGYTDCKFLFVDSSYKQVTGYQPEQHQQGGLGFWFSKIHPDDRRMLSDRIIESMKICKHSSGKVKPDPHTLNYRFKKGTGKWVWMQHTVYNISYDRKGTVNKVLHRLQLLEELKYPVEEEGIIPFHSLKQSTGGLNNLTTREKQVLKLIAEGFSTKIIADKLQISINTVETYRKRMLEKLEAKNSMELIKKAFALFWN